MIPLRIELKNFRAVEYADIDLSAVSLAAIAGRNGAGKSSSFTLAPRFALFGDVISGVGLDDLVRKGAHEMAVVFEFEHQGDRYRTIRTRSTKGKGKSTLELQLHVGDQWESRSAEKIVDTEAVIRSLLNLDDETFTASSMILQGQANAFTGATAGRRKEILSQILGLNVYEQLQERARVKAGILHLEIEKGKDKLLALDERLSGRESKQAELLAAEDQHDVIYGLIAWDEQQIRDTETTLADLKAKAERAGQLVKDMVLIENEVVSLQAERAEQVARRERSEKILANEAAIAAKSEELEQLRQQITTLKAREPEAERLRRDLVGTVEKLRRLDESLTSLHSRIASLDRQLADRETLRKQADEHAEESERLLAYEAKAEEWNLLAAEVVDLQARHDREVSRLLMEERILDEKIAALEKQEAHIHDSGCLPTCKFQLAAAAAVAELPELRRRRAELDREEVARLVQALADKQLAQQGLGYDVAEHRACKARADASRAAATAYAQLAGKEELLQQLRHQHADMATRESELISRRNDLEHEIVVVADVLAPLPNLIAKSIELQRWAQLRDQLAAARETAATAGERLLAIHKEIDAKQTRQEALSLEREGLLLETLEHDTKQDELARQQGILREHRSHLAALVERIGGIKATLAALEADQQERDRLSDELAPISQRWARYQTLIKAYGRDGIPALIIENAVPQLERIANEILGQMSKGKHYIRFETQRELKTRAGLSETLDILIGDWSAERPYETFSGGEQLRIDYAIRFALAELLAQRAGSKVEWLTIDEGLGSQDAEHRALVLDAIKSVAGRFRKVLVITHIEDAQAAFDQVIRFDNSDGAVSVLVG
ncbi:AAA family ATPase [Cohnella sp. JJ-181]|uniref:AAA family ATPase n=1 Tax=Cohnella rhizoplanae TaxID=2974897 RepID=UPI0022FFB096|nr:SMC family ATPase [Cohnella sp. JJ-181]CAI6087218.1 Chromosome partition protein Smc [Cohnella sp. JJ-181]